MLQALRKRKSNLYLTEFKNTKLDLFTITETKKKEHGVAELNNDHLIIYSGVKMAERKAARLGCIIYSNIKNKLHKWKAFMERILLVQMNE